MAEFTGIALQTVAQGEDVALTETPVCATKCIVHRQGSGILSGEWKNRIKISSNSVNIQWDDVYLGANYE